MIRLRIHQAMFALALLSAAAARAQSTKVSGTITDAATGETLPGVNILFRDSRVGTTTDIDGAYSIDTYYATDSLLFSFIGYVPRMMPVRKDKAQVIDVKLEPSATALEEVVIKPSGENPAFEILRRVIRSKPANNREKLEAYSFEAYNKVEFDLNNISKEFTEKRIFRPFAFIFDNIDSTGAKPYLPIFMTESLSEVVYRQKPRARKEFIRGTKVSGMENESISQFMGDMYQNVNIYDNFLVIFGRNFISPIADGGKGYYDYYLTDSAFVGKFWCYRLDFKPKRPQELAFAGTMWINDTTYAVRRIEAGIPEKANLNFVQGFWVKQEYDQVKPEVWMLSKDELVVDLNIVRDAGKPNKHPVQGLYGRRTASYRDFTINELKDAQVYEGAEEVVMAIEPLSLGADFWDTHRHEQLSKKENDIYHMVDTMKQIPRFRTYIDIVNTAITGYYPLGDVELGPYFTTYSFNPVEGNRFRLGLRTSSQWSRRVELEGYTAYGTTDGVFKYGLGGRGFITKDPRLIGGLYYRLDLEQLGQSTDAFRQDNILSSTFRRTPNNKLTLVDEWRAYLDREWFMGFNSLLMLRRRQLFPRGTLEYITFSDANEPFALSSITTTEAIFSTRFAYKEKYVAGDFTRVSLGTRYPSLEVMVAKGLQGVLGGDYDYTKLSARLYHRVPMGTFGFLRYWLHAGQVFSEPLPYPLLIIHAGNETFYFDELAFNTMNFFEFVSDRYASIYIDHHFDGLFLNRIPLFRRLKWREVVGGKAVVGALDRKHLGEMALLPFSFDLSGGPFAEVSVGVENVFKMLRFDMVRRLTYMDHANTKPWAFRVRMNVTF
ncbi:MAG: carboxypeptidase-like regulatory domain-containing protein [Flavobacteriales bacterium]|nr:carboxypeptidase-like regulatory domain-containing protein [Flavobacteriales bacterium]